MGEQQWVGENSAVRGGGNSGGCQQWVSNFKNHPSQH